MRLAMLLVLSSTLLAGCADRQTIGASSSIAVDPDALDFGVSRVGTALERATTLKNVGRDVVAIAAIEIDGAGASSFSVKQNAFEPLPVGSQVNVRIVYRPTEPGSHLARLLIRTDADNGAELSVRLVGVAQPAPAVCGVGEHLCGETCLSDFSVDGCGDSCTRCPVDPHGTATCDGTGCGVTCDAGFHRCDGACVSDFAVENCGSRCLPCASDPNGTATCDGAACGLTCNPGARLCGGVCAVCPVGVDSKCSGTECIAVCPADQTPCDGGCCSTWTVETLSPDGNPFTPEGGSVALAFDSRNCADMVFYGWRATDTSGISGLIHHGVRCGEQTNWTSWSPDNAIPSGRGFGLSISAKAGVGPKQLAYVSRSNGSTAWSADLGDLAIVCVEKIASGAISPALEYDFEGIQHAVYIDESSRSLMFASRLATGWTSQHLADRAYDQTASLVIEQNGKRHVAFVAADSATETSLRYIGFTGTSGPIVETVARGVLAAAMKVDGTGTVHIAFTTTEDGVVALKYATKTSRGWTIEDVDAISSVGPTMSLALDRSGRAHISYFDADAMHLKYAVQSANGWATRTVDTDVGPSRNSAIALDADDEPYILYTIGRSSDGSDQHVRLAHY